MEAPEARRMTLIIDLGNGKQAIVSSDDRTDEIRLALWVNRGSSGVGMTKKQAIELSRALWDAVYSKGAE